MVTAIRSGLSIVICCWPSARTSVTGDISILVLIPGSLLSDTKHGLARISVHDPRIADAIDGLARIHIYNALIANTVNNLAGVRIHNPRILNPVRRLPGIYIYQPLRHDHSMTEGSDTHAGCKTNLA